MIFVTGELKVDSADLIQLTAARRDRYLFSFWRSN